MPNDNNDSLVAEVARLREENAALGGHLLSLGVERDRDVLRATNALGRAHAALSHAVAYAPCDCGPPGDVHDDECAHYGADAVLADPEGRAAGEYLRALEAEHDAAGRYRKSIATHVVHIGGGDLDDAHAAVEALRGK